MQLMVVTGLSGAGKSQVIRVLEDLGWFCVDNLPPELLPKFTELLDAQERIDRVAVVIDVRGRAFFEGIETALTGLEERRVNYRIIFLEARDEILLHRFQETRRRHPLAEEGRVIEAIGEERRRLHEVRGRAHFTLDTSDLTTKQLRGEVERIISQEAGLTRLLVQIVSFGFKRGVPLDADLLFDVRFLPNPNYVPELHRLTGRHPEVRDYVLGWPISHQLLGHLTSLVDFLLPQYMAEGKSQLVLAIGCTGGQHRSVVIAEQLAERIKAADRQIFVEHRDCERAAAEQKA